MPVTVTSIFDDITCRRAPLPAVRVMLIPVGQSIPQEKPAQLGPCVPTLEPLHSRIALEGSPAWGIAMLRSK